MKANGNDDEEEGFETISEEDISDDDNDKMKD
jgi:hypothetical protein